MKQIHKSDMMYITLNNCPLPETKHIHYKWHLKTSFFMDTLHFSEKGKLTVHFVTM